MEKLLVTLNHKILAAGEDRKLSDKFKQLKTDEERLIFVLKLLTEYEIVPSLEGQHKNTEYSTKSRETGNKIFIAGSDHKAVTNYTESIAYADKSSVELALAYANRSAALFRIKKYEDCLNDVNRALRLEYPSKLKTKLYERKGLCLLALGRPDAECSFQEALIWLDHMSLNEEKKSKLKHQLQNSISASYAMVEVPENETVYAAPIIMAPNVEVPCASNALSIKYSNELGRHVVAARDIRSGEVLAVEKPYSLILSPENVYTHCSNCLKVSWAMIPCEHCVNAMYCSQNCKEKAWKDYHEVECQVVGILLNLELNMLILFSMRLAILATQKGNNIVALKRELAEVDQTEDPRVKGFSSDGKLHSDEYRAVYSLVTNTEKRSVGDLFGRAFDAACMIYIISRKSSMFGKRLELAAKKLAQVSDITFVGGLILRHQQIIPSNIHSFTELRGLESHERGAAAMPFHSLINHSCDPNVVRHSLSDCIVMYALYPIRKGEQIVDNYGQHYALTEKSNRQQKLNKQFYFTCRCQPCVEDWPLYHQLPSYQEQPLGRQTKIKLNKVLQKHNRYIELAFEGVTDKEPNMLNNLLRMVDTLFESVQRPCQDLNNVIETVKRFYDLQGNKLDIPE